MLRPLADRSGQCAKLLVVVGLSHKTVQLSDGGISKYVALYSVTSLMAVQKFKFKTTHLLDQEESFFY